MGCIESRKIVYPDKRNWIGQNLNNELIYWYIIIKNIEKYERYAWSVKAFWGVSIQFQSCFLPPWSRPRWRHSLSSS